MQSCAESHATFFACNGKLTTSSMKEAHSKQGITSGVKLKCWAIQNLLAEGKLDPTPSNLAQLENPAATGIWNTKGEFDKKRFDQLAARSIKDKGHDILTREIFDAFLFDLHEDYDYGLATKLMYVVPVTWKAITKGSIDELFRYYSDHWYLNNGVYEKALTVEQALAFYTNPNAIMERRIAGEFQIPKPS